MRTLHRLPAVIAGLAATAAVLAGCSIHFGKSDTATSVAPPQFASGTATALIQEPKAGYVWASNMINAAKSTVTLTMYELNDSTIEDDLITAKERGVDVKILLDKDFTAGKVNAAAYANLQNWGVAVKWEPNNIIVHQKTLCADSTCVAGSGNFTAKYYPTTEDAFLTITDTSEVNAIKQTFANDWAAAPANLGQAVSAANLIWSPGASFSLVALIQSAKHSIQFSSEELSSTPIIDALASAASDGITCQILMTDSKSWHKAFDTLTKAGCHVATYIDESHTLYIHEKQIIIDDATLALGSQNATPTSLNKNRELSITTTQADVVKAAETEYATIFERGTLWQ